jgi:hypothetical protein
VFDHIAIHSTALAHHDLTSRRKRVLKPFTVVFHHIKLVSLSQGKIATVSRFGTNAKCAPNRCRFKMHHDSLKGVAVRALASAALQRSVYTTSFRAMTSL